MSAVLHRTTFESSRLLEFCSRKELVAQTGAEPDAWPMMVVKELIDNALDACEEGGIAPVIRVTVARGRIRVRDNGPGIPAQTVASILDFGTRTSSREAYVAPDRGHQGNALKTILAMPFALSGEEGRVEIVARGIRHEITFRVDRIAQQPAIDHQQHSSSVRTGTAITVHWPASASSDPADAAGEFLPMAQRFTDLNPHLTLHAIWVDEDRRERWSGEAVDSSWTKWTPSSPTCPHWYAVGHLERLAGAFLHHDRQYKTVRLLRDFLAQFNGLTGTAKRKAVLDAVGLQRVPLERLLSDGEDFDHDLVRRLLVVMKGAARPIKPGKLGLLGKQNIAACLVAYGGDPQSFRYKLLQGVDDGVPWLAEAAFAYRPDSIARALLTGVNWSPSLVAGGDPFRLGYQLGAHYCGPDEPILLLAHLVCPRPEFLDRGKTTLAYHSPGYAAVRDAVAEVTEAWKKQREGEIRDRKREANRLDKLRRRRAVVVSLKELVIKHLPNVIAKVSTNDRISFTQRDVFYAMRPIIQKEHEKELTYSYFTSLLTDIEYEQGEIKGLQREDRGSIYHPHLRQEIPLNTETVARYHRPFWNFNKVCLIEKAGTQQNLIEVSWPEEHDCALVSTKGFSTRAVKDLFDLLATSPEPVTVFCVHDADAAGTMIYHTLVNETKARGARKIEVVNLGLEPWEGIEMELEVEAVEATDKRRAVARYVAEHDEEWRDWLERRGFDSWDAWLQKHRIELNAMAPLDRVAWITRKIEAYPPRKVVPPAHVLRGERVSEARREISEELTRRARIDERTAKLLAKIKWPDAEKLPPVVTRYLDRAHNRQDNWRSPMRLAGMKHAKRVLKP